VVEQLIEAQERAFLEGGVMSRFAYALGALDTLGIMGTKALAE
jgi:hypothetical protein